MENVGRRAPSVDALASVGRVLRLLPGAPLKIAVGFCVLVITLLTVRAAPERVPPASILDDHLLITWYGNPHSTKMGILGERAGMERAQGLRKQAAAYVPLTSKTVLMAYHLVAVVAQCTAGADGKWRRRESPGVIRALLDEARENGFKLILDIQPGRSTVAAEVTALRPFLAEPDVYLALDPEFAVSGCEEPGRSIGRLFANDVNAALTELDALIAQRSLPPKVLIVHQFRLDMLPDKRDIQTSPMLDVVLNMDGFGSQALKRSSYRAVMQQGPLEFAGVKLFYRQDTNLFTPAQVMGLVPRPSVVIYQ
jgi:hypothetical protein